MSVEVLRKTLDYLCNNALLSENKRFDITFFGGEPMLNPDVIEEGFRYGVELAEKHDIEFGASMSTNGTLLTPRMKQVIAKYKDITGFGVQLSIDGIKEIHDRHRVFKSGGGSFETIQENIPAWLELYKDNVKAISVHGCLSPETLPYLFKNYKFFKEEWKVRTQWYLPIQTLDWQPEHVDIYETELRKIKDYIMEEITRDKTPTTLLDFYPFDRSFNAIREFGNTACGAGAYSVAVAANGDIYPCQQLYYNDPTNSTYLGNVFDGIEDIKRRIFTDYDSTELSCYLLRPQCDAVDCVRCIAENFLKNGSLFSTVGCDGNICRMFQLERKLQKEINKELGDIIEKEEFPHTWDWWQYEE